jgi:putative Ca2+/H+ antiporter (TMEM165/GDT1 family)
MDMKLFFSTFAAIFLAELGDKTQLAVLAIASESQRGVRLVVFLASALALTATSAVAVFGGDLISRYVSPVWLKRVAGAMFLVMGAIFLLRSGKPD